MKGGRRADFFFVGLGTMPIALMVSGYPDLAIFLFVPLLIIACLCGATEQIEASPTACAKSGSDIPGTRGDSGRPVPGVSLRGHGPKGESG